MGFSTALPITHIIAEHKRGVVVGIPSICSANRFVIEACMQQALEDNSPLLVESTCNQVNQYGGYTGMNAAAFTSYIGEIARQMDFPGERLILGGDHLGPYPWAGENPASAMDKARRLAQEYVKAGYVKIHLDASMPLGGEAGIDLATSAQRAAALCQAAEDAASQRDPRYLPRYVIGTEVPPPGGAREMEDAAQATHPDDVQQTLAIARHAFRQRGLEAAWERVIAVVVQPGVEYGDEFISAYQRDQGAQLSDLIEGYPNLVYEAHSTDYQTPEALRQLVEDHFAILKVGPALTFAFREAVFALAAIEKEWLGESHLIDIIEAAMQADPGYWQGYYRGDERQLAFARKYSLSDRIRYYWARPEMQAALDELITRLENSPPPLALISQHLPAQYWDIREGRLRNEPRQLIRAKIREITAQYAWACGLSAQADGGWMR
jgi:D-tagatose-1,6-bisphosphate aldolase subunit GatZ/KbaZ